MRTMSLTLYLAIFTKLSWLMLVQLLTEDPFFRYERNWEAEEKEKKKKRKLKAKAAAVSLCGDSYTNYCDTRAFFLTPVKSKTKNKVDIRSVCKIL